MSHLVTGRLDGQMEHANATGLSNLKWNKGNGNELDEQKVTGSNLSPHVQLDMITAECPLISMTVDGNLQQSEHHAKNIATDNSCLGVKNRFHIGSSALRFVSSTRQIVVSRLQKHKVALNIMLRSWAVLAYAVYLVYALVHRFDQSSITLLVVTCLVTSGGIYNQIRRKFGSVIRRKISDPLTAKCKPYENLIKRLLTLLVIFLITTFIIVDVLVQRPGNLVSGVGILVIILLTFCFSRNPSQVRWRPVLWGLLLQFVFAVLVIRTQWGKDAFDWLGQGVRQYLHYADSGAEFVFGKTFKDHFFAFQVTSVIVFFSASISVLYYLGWMQMIIGKLAVIMQFSLGTGAVESLHAAVNVFVGMTEAITVVRPMLDKMTSSELHTVMASGFSTVSGSTLAIYVMYGAPASHLISASVMSAPAALAVSKLFYPESPEKPRDDRDDCHISREGTSIIDAASVGATGAISMIAYMLTSVIAFISIIAFMNASLEWLGARVGLEPPDYPVLSFQLICSYVFWPLVFLMGVPPSDCRIVARLVGMKIFVNELIAYEDLGQVMMNARNLTSYNGTWYTDGNDVILEPTNQTLIGGVMSPRSEVIATYALCGFSNITALGLMIAALTALAPSRKKDIVAVSVRALISGCTACFLTASIAGLLI